jgi:hypothetical protein
MAWRGTAGARMRRPEATDHHLVRHGDRLPFGSGAGAGAGACKLSRVRHRRRQLVALCWLAVGGDGCPGRQRHSSSSSCSYGRVRARFVKLMRLYIDYGYGMCRRRVLCDGCECFHDGGRGVCGECTGVRPHQVLRTDSGGGSSVLASSLTITRHTTANQPARTWVWSLY